MSHDKELEKKGCLFLVIGVILSSISCVLISKESPDWLIKIITVPAILCLILGIWNSFWSIFTFK